MPGSKNRTPPLLRRCVAGLVAKGTDTSAAFAICVASLQKHGLLQPGSVKLTAKGKKRQRSRVQQPDHKDKMGDYERALKRARKTEEALVQEAFRLPNRFRAWLTECRSCA